MFAGFSHFFVGLVKQQVTPCLFFLLGHFAAAKVLFDAPAFVNRRAGTDFVDRPPEWGAQQLGYYEENDYHQPSDEYDPNWNLSGTIQDALIGFWDGIEVANADEMPTWNEGDEFEAVRLEALATVQE